MGHGTLPQRPYDRTVDWDRFRQHRHSDERVGCPVNVDLETRRPRSDRNSLTIVRLGTSGALAGRYRVGVVRDVVVVDRHRSAGPFL